MPRPFSPDRPELEEVKLRIMDQHVDMTRWTSYEVASDFLTPADGWHFVVADEDLPQRQREALTVGARVGLFINKTSVLDGHIDTIEISASKQSGQTWTIAGRDRLGFAVDATADPTLQFKEGATLEDVLKKVFFPYGWIADEHFSIDNAENRIAATGGDRGIKTSKKGKPLKSYVLHLLKPHNHEGVFAFAARVAQRFGLWIWCSVDGDTLIVAKPDFDQEPTYQLRRTLDGTGNVIDGAVKFDFTDQPSVIIADGFSGGGEFGKGRIKSYAVNPFFGVDEDGFALDEVTNLVAQFPEANQVVLVTEPFKRRAPNTPIRPMFLHDDESKTQEQLDNFVRREMSLLTRKSLQAHYTVEGHGQLLENDIFVPWEVDTVVDVHDELAGINERMYLLARTFTKSRRGGTKTSMTLVRLNSIQF